MYYNIYKAKNSNVCLPCKEGYVCITAGLFVGNYTN